MGRCPFQARGFDGSGNLVKHRAVGWDAGAERAGVKIQGGQGTDAVAAGRATHRKRGAAVGAEARIISVARTQRRRIEGVGACGVMADVAIWTLVFVVRGPTRDVATVAVVSLARRKAVAQPHHYIADLLAEGQCPIVGSIGRHREAVVTPVIVRQDLIGHTANIQSEISHLTRRDRKAIAHVRAACGLHPQIPTTRCELPLRLAIDRHPVAILGHGASEAALVELRARVEAV